jgi:peptide/nickel transport system ATP-binding protein
MANPLTHDIDITVDGRLLVDIHGFQIPRDRITFLFGESGIGKSLIAQTIYGLLDPEEFTIQIDGQPYENYLHRPETQAIRNNSFFVFQEPSSHLNPLLPLRYQINEGSLSEAPSGVELLKELWEGSDAEEIQGLLGVYPKPYRPSGGEKQRMFLVMALKKMDMVLRGQRDASQSLFVFDEPTGSLDNHFRNIFLSLLFRRFQKERITILFITHDYSVIGQVLRAHTSMLDHVSFKEIRRRINRLEMKDFETKTYIGWLKEQGFGKGKPAPVPASAPLLTVEGNVGVFGQKLTISRSPEGDQPCPLELFPGAMVYLKGPSGEGKTTFMKMIMGLTRGERLRLRIGNRTVTEQAPARYWRDHLWGKRMTMVFQHADEALNPRSKVREIFQGLPTLKRMTVEEMRRKLRELFAEELSDAFLDKPVSALSGGQKQRLNLLRGLALETEVLLLDEPLNGLDFESTTKVITLLEEKQRAGQGILLVSHNEEIVETMVPDQAIYYLVRTEL